MDIHGIRICLWGGEKACNELDTFLARRPMNRLPMLFDRYGRRVASCSVGNVDLGEWLVRNGLALDWPRYPNASYQPFQREAVQPLLCQIPLVGTIFHRAPSGRCLRGPGSVPRLRGRHLAPRCESRPYGYDPSRKGFGAPRWDTRSRVQSPRPRRRRCAHAPAGAV